MVWRDFLEKLGFRSVKYPDIYFHSGAITNHTKDMIKNSIITVVNSTILKNYIEEIVEGNDLRRIRVMNLYEKDDLVFYEFDATQCQPPEPMVNTIHGLKMLKSEKDRLVGIFFS